MKGAIKTGVPAFPEAHAEHNHAFPSSPITRYTPGMTLRDHFAGEALASGQASNWRDNDFKPRNGLSIIENTAIAAYEFADAMLKAREGGAA